MTLTSIVEQISQLTGAQFGRAAAGSIEALAALGASDDVLDFYRDFDPKVYVEINGARLWPSRELIGENTNYVPGCDLRPRGFFVIGSTDCGDAFCLDQRPRSSGQVVLMTHDVSWEEVTDQDIERYTLVAASSFVAFLKSFVAGTLPMEPLHDPQAT